MDWADEIVAAMQLPYEALKLGKHDEIAAALRKAKADGIAEAGMLLLEERLDEMP